ncbi:uncharacterized protein LOC127442236 [Myxocyprinus asiaticus]|uniref:uncharacterized protein LOC127442236 n=1 Tax=Myxocyprinus asiaticus TaxID=70543 RepID=UPI0022219807|nr:uncharacterized protein LOC127442236 [Myxocyprinus asiaticus]XP_051556076.1 uncharacterized protein LOC127442236 [Myxocyprinus asiaticus]
MFLLQIILRKTVGFCLEFCQCGLEYPLAFGNPITLTVIPKDVPETPPTLSILSPLKGSGGDICLAAGFFPAKKNMTLIANDKSSETQSTSNALLFTNTKTYYYAGFNNKDIEQCKMDQVEKNKALNTFVTDKPDRLIPLHCETKYSEFKNTDGPKANSMTLLVTEDVQKHLRM